MAKNSILPIFIPHGGCPHRCVFCNQREISGCHQLPQPEELALLLPPDFPAEGELAFYGGSFTALPPEILKTYLRFAAEQKEKGRISHIRVSTHPAYVDQKVIAQLLVYGVDFLELGVQSLDDTVLEQAGRGHDSKTVFSALEALASSSLAWGVQLMLGLPSDTEEKDIASVLRILPYEPQTARLYPLLVIADTPLAAAWRKGSYLPLSLDEAVSIAGKMYALFVLHGVPVIRMGLQPTEDLKVGGKSLLAGPFHPAFGHLVRAALKQEQMARVAMGHENEDIRFLCAKDDLPLVFGDQKKNIESFAVGRKVAVSGMDLPPGSLAAAPYDKGAKRKPFAVLSERDFLLNYTQTYRSSSCI
ncbi:MAG TPA: radical SAM protein [Clostridiales bacterium]|nr:radical SAM protein [Clostridiales bacterium]